MAWLAGRQADTTPTCPIDFSQQSQKSSTEGMFQRECERENIKHSIRHEPIPVRARVNEERLNQEKKERTV
jgi:hypothetical protein